MAASDQRYKIVDTVGDCIVAVDDLLKQNIIAVDAEGVNLGKDGPLTLLQVAKLDGFVYLFNVYVEPKVFGQGRLKSVLESKDILKVYHACSKDSAALKCQFGVTLTNVFDIQAVQYIVDKAQGRQLPSPLKLVDLCKLYTDVSSLDTKDEIQEKWNKTDGAYWAKRTLTQEMIDYACADVRIMIPDVYEKLKSILDEKTLWKEFQERVMYELQFRWNDQLRNQEKAKTMSVINRLLHQFDRKYPPSAKLTDITDDDDMNALKQIRFQDVGGFPPIVRTLKNQCLQEQIDAIETEMNHKGEDFVLLGSHIGMIVSCKNCSDIQLKRKAARLNERMDGILKKQLDTKYDETTPAKFLTQDERRFMRRLPASTGNSFNRVLRHLYNVSIDADVDEIRSLKSRFHQEGRRFSLLDDDHRKFKYYISAPCIPSRLKAEARQFLNELQHAGVVADPRRRYRHNMAFFDDDFLYSPF